MSSARITYSQRPDTTPGAEVSTLSNIYKLVLDSAEKRGRLPDKSGPDDAMMKQIEEVSHVEQRPD